MTQNMNLPVSRPKETEFPRIEDWGLIPYGEALERQKSYVKDIFCGQRRETLVFCHHPSVVTLGRGTREGDVFSWTGEKFEVNRGGRATYHGPGQLVMYPIIDLGGQSPSFIKKKIKNKDLHDYMRFLEQSLILTLRDYGVQAQGHSPQKQVEGKEPALATGVWVGHQKLASIGIGVKKWITHHGMAVNLFKDREAFQGIKPCGFDSDTMICLEEMTSQRVKRRVLQKELTSHFIFLVYTDRKSHQE